MDSLVAGILSACSAPARCPHRGQDESQPGSGQTMTARHAVQDHWRHAKLCDALQPENSSVAHAEDFSSCAMAHAGRRAGCRADAPRQCLTKPARASQSSFQSLSLDLHNIHDVSVDEHTPVAPAPREHLEAFYSMPSTRPLSVQARGMEAEHECTVHRMLQLRGFAPALLGSQGKHDMYHLHHSADILEPLSPSARLHEVLDLLKQ